MNDYNYNIDKIEQTAKNLAELLKQRENYLIENFADDFPVVDYAEDDKLSQGIATFWEVVGRVD